MRSTSSTNKTKVYRYATLITNFVEPISYSCSHRTVVIPAVNLPTNCQFNISTECRNISINKLRPSASADVPVHHAIGDIHPVRVGEGVGELSDSDLVKEKREDIATALGIPQTILFSQAANYATAKEMGEPTARFYTERQDDLRFFVVDIVEIPD